MGGLFGCLVVWLVGSLVVCLFIGSWLLVFVAVVGVGIGVFLLFVVVGCDAAAVGAVVIVDGGVGGVGRVDGAVAVLLLALL